MIRATTGGVLRSYRKNLMNSFISLNKSRDTALSQRNFNSYAEDPAAASRAFQMRRSLARVESQYTVNDSVMSKYNVAYSAIESVKRMVANRSEGDNAVAWSDVIVALNDPTGDGRTALGKSLTQLAETVVQTMTHKYGDTFVFAGADGLNVPFTWENDKLCYRGIPVDTEVPELVTNGGTPVEIDPQTGTVTPGTGVYLKAGSTSTMDAADYDPTDPDAPMVLTDGTGPILVNSKGEIDPAGDRYLVLSADGTAVSQDSTITKDDYDKAVSDLEKLKYMCEEEKTFVDIGLGMKENVDGDLIESSAYNSALQGINFLGYGVDEDGDPKNIVSLIKQLGDICSSYQDGTWVDSSWEDLDRLAGKLEDSIGELDNEYVDLTASTQKLKNNEKLLEENAYTLQEQISNVEDVDMAEAITSFVWAQYCYNAALKVGNSILSQSLMDYLN